MILVVEDYADTRNILLRLLGMDGYEATGVDSGQYALEWMSARTPSLVLLDYRLPDLSGFDVFHQMKKDARLAGVPVVMLSADGDAIRSEALALGVAAYIAKGSLDWLEIRKHIQKLIGPGLANRGQHSPGPTASGPSATRTA